MIWVPKSCRVAASCPAAALLSTAQRFSAARAATASARAIASARAVSRAASAEALPDAEAGAGEAGRATSSLQSDAAQTACWVSERTGCQLLPRRVHRAGRADGG